MYAIVDIETTGGYASANGITEICIHVFDGEKTTGVFTSLVNPRQKIPRYIQAMTGITDEMVSSAPYFEEIAEKVYELLQPNIFIAHNVNFDHSFIRTQLAACGFNLNVKKLCTVRMSRKILPGFPSYGLGNLCQSLGITINDRHRAGGDTAATVEVFKMLLAGDRENFISKSLARNSKEQMLPPNVPKEHFDKLPYTPGVYYFHNAKGKVIYVGKAKNIRYRVNSHFSSNSDSRQRQNFLKHTHAISFTSCGTELMAHILESTEIKKFWPAFNSSQKRPEQLFGLFLFEDQNGYKRLALDKTRKGVQSLTSYATMTEAQSALRQLIRAHGLCPRLCFLQKSSEPCDGSTEYNCSGACEGAELPEHYNQRVDEALRSIDDTRGSYAIVERGLQMDDQSCVLIWKGQFYGMGYIPGDVSISEPEALKDFLTPYKENLFIRNLVNVYASKNPDKVKWLA
ncbi:MAG: DNA polymerase III subunit epsilon [Chitinophagaceae bacterium]|nr:MAG: DNA polymerase III subunit epsilon [Chitinophagaceae bacterium]